MMMDARLLTPNQTWRPLASRVRGDEHHNDIYMAVGHALSVWEWLEENLGYIFALLVESKSSAASQVYAVISSSKTKAQMLEVAFGVFEKVHGLQPEVREAFKGLLNHYLKAMDYRNHIAHGTVVSFGAETEFSGCFLVPPVYNARRYLIPDDKLGMEMAALFGSAQYRYTAVDIAVLTGRFQALSQMAKGVRGMLVEGKFVEAA